MIPLKDRTWQSQPWQWQLGHAVQDASELAALLNIEFEPVPTRFPLKVPHAFIQRMEPGNLADPLLRQVLPVQHENEMRAGYHSDAVGDLAAASGPGMLHKYQGRVLVIVSGACAINCRYCFRREFPYTDFQPDQADWDQIVAQVSEDNSIHEVILSGGDPLVIADRRLALLAQRLTSINHVDTIRIHSRLPIVLPARVNDELCHWISDLSATIVMVAHANHPNEIDDDVRAAMAKLRRAGATLLNQSVLLAGINDEVTTLAALSRKLFQADILPYYLHLPDPVTGTHHFNIEPARAIRLMAELRQRLPGYLVPRLVREVAGAPSKVPVF